ncbi:MAG: protein phosphatase 2C domain-containing protein [Bdellovibrionales bacterium]|nr:protein phosphatase 2C domain-containing protein [Bdellovibrionales bacterium]
MDVSPEQQAAINFNDPQFKTVGANFTYWHLIKVASKESLLEELSKIAKKINQISADKGELPLKNLISEEDLKNRSLAYAKHAFAEAFNGHRVSTTPISAVGPISLEDICIKTVQITGRKHAVNGKACQDQAVITRSRDYLVVVQSDGVSSAKYSDIGALLQSHLTTEAVFESLSELESNFEGKLSSPEFLASIYSKLYLKIFQVLDEIELDAASVLKQFICATNKILIVSAEESIIFTMDDGFISLYDHLIPVEELVDLPPALKEINFAPLINTAIVEDSIFPEAHKKKPNLNRPSISLEPPNGRMTDEYQMRFMLAIDEILKEEARGFHVGFCAPSAELFSSSVLFCTDGVRFTEGIIRDERYKYFPLFEWAEKYSQPTLEYYTALFNLVAFYQKDESLTKLVKFLISFDNQTLHADEDKMENPVSKLFSDQACAFIIKYEKFLENFNETGLSAKERAVKVLEELEKQNQKEHLYRIQMTLSLGAGKAIARFFNWESAENPYPLFDDVYIISISTKSDEK